MSLDEVAGKLDEKFKAAPFDTKYFRLRQPGLPEDAVREVEDELDLELPVSFRRVIQTYDLGGATIGVVRFGNPDYADFLIEENDPDIENPWWASGERPDSLLFADSDGYAFVVRLADGRILAFRHGHDVKTAAVVAHDLEAFLRGAGTAYFNRKSTDPQLVPALADGVGAESAQFWSEVVRGIT